MANRTVAGRPSLLKRLQLAAAVFLSLELIEQVCPLCGRQSEPEVLAIVDELMERTERVLSRHAPTLWDRLPRIDAAGRQEPVWKPIDRRLLVAAAAAVVCALAWLAVN